MPSLHQCHSLNRPEVSPSENQLLLAVTHQFYRHKVLGNDEAQLCQCLMVPIKPSIQSFKSCEPAVLLWLDTPQLWIILWPGVFPLPVILKHGFKPFFELGRVWAIAALLFYTYY